MLQEIRYCSDKSTIESGWLLSNAHQDSIIAKVPDHVVEQGECALVRPVQVVEVEEEAIGLAHRLEEPGDCVEQPQARLVCRQGRVC